MSQSKATAPDFALSREIDMTGVDGLRRYLADLAPEGARVPSFNDFVVKACGLALREHPRVNGSYCDGTWELYEQVNVGIAVAAEDGGLLVPTVAGADRLNLGEIARTTRRLSQSARAGTLTPPDLAGGTFTVSNLGMFGVRTFTAVINPPQAAILAVGSVERKPVVQGDEIVPGLRMEVTLSCDHRILSGADGAEFLRSVAAFLESPGGLIL
jgi:pyruvate dehydrogenase E2 component (dihydrolipoamide acetyltransferase)